MRRANIGGAGGRKERLLAAKSRVHDSVSWRNSDRGRINIYHRLPAWAFPCTPCRSIKHFDFTRGEIRYGRLRARVTLLENA